MNKAEFPPEDNKDTLIEEVYTEEERARDNAAIENYVDPVLAQLEKESELTNQKLVEEKTDQIRNTFENKTKDSSYSPEDAFPAQDKIIWPKEKPENLEPKEGDALDKEAAEILKIQLPEKKTDTLSTLKNRFLAFLGFSLAATAVNAGTLHEKNPNDSLIGKKDNIENVLKKESRENISDQLKSDWNDYTKWIADQGMRGKEELNTGGVGYKYFDQYVQEHQGKTLLSREMLPIIASQFKHLRDWMIKEVRAGRKGFAQGVTEANFMKWVSENEKTAHPEYPGSNFTAGGFPSEFEFVFDEGEVDYNTIANLSMNEKNVTGKMNNIENINNKFVKKENKGFAKIKNENTVSRMKDIAKNK